MDAPKPSLKTRFSNLMAEYGKVALGVYLTIFAAVMGGFAVAFKLGFQSSTATGAAGTLAAAWLAAKATQPVRVLATLVLTPFVAKVLERTRFTKAPPAGP